MTTSKSIKFTLLFPALYISLYAILAIYSNAFDKSVESLLVAICVSIGVWILGLFVGVFISAILKSPQKEFYYYLIGQSIMVVIIVGIVIYQGIETRLHERKYGNIEHNRSFLFLNRDGEVDTYTNPLYVKTGFNCLEAQFENHNDFRLTDFFSFYTDSTNGTYTDTLRVLYFTYITKDNKELFAKVHVFEGKATLQMFNEIIATNQEFIQARKENFRREEETNKKAVEMLKELKETLKNDPALNK